MSYLCDPAECEHDDGVSGRIWASGHSEFTCNLCGVEMWATGPDPDDAWEPASTSTGDANARRTAAVSPPLSTSVPGTGTSLLPHPDRPARTAPITDISDYFLATVTAAHPEWDFDQQLEAAERLTFRYVR